MASKSRLAAFRIDRGRRILRILPTGSDDLDTLLATIPVMVAHHDFKPILGRAWDLTSMEWKPTVSEALALIRACRSIPRHPHAGKNALIVEHALYKDLQATVPEAVVGATGRVHRAFPSFFEAEIWLLGPLFTPDSRGRIEIPPEALEEWRAEEARYGSETGPVSLPPDSHRR
jgi:hypothetical protein